MRNLKRALSLTLASVMLLGMMIVGTSAASYPDVTEEDNIEAIEVLQAVQVMRGDDNGNFRPNDPVSRAEMAVVMALLLDLDYQYYEASCPFNDVPSWARSYVGACYANGIVSGYNATTYGANDGVTAVQAASMLMRALGYFQYASDYKDGFETATVRQASKIRLFDGVNANARDNLTRDQVARLALNGLETPIVEAEDNTFDITSSTGNTSVTMTGGQVNYVVTASKQPFASAIKKDETSGTGLNQVSGAIIELGEKLYNGELKLNEDSRDAFGRPARAWEYKGKEVGTYAKEEQLKQEYTVKVTGKMLYDLLGSGIVNNSDYTVNVTIDGNEGNDPKNFGKADITRTNTSALGGTGNGTLTQVYVDGDKHIVDIAIINTYLAIASGDYSEKKDEVSLTVHNLKKSGSLYSKDTADPKSETTPLKVGGDDFVITNVAKDDKFLVTVANGEIKSMIAPEVLSGETITSHKTNSYVVAGQQYDYTTTAQYDTEVMESFSSDDMKEVTYNIILDQYGYLIGLERNEKVDRYVFLSGIDDDYSYLSKKNVPVNIIHLDGTMETVTMNTKDSSNFALSGEANSQANTWCTYSVDNNGIYTLKQVAAATDSTSRPKVKVAQSAMDADVVTAPVADQIKINSKNISLDGSGSGVNAIDKVHGNDDTVYINVDLADVKVSSTAYKRIVDDVNSVTTGVTNVDLTVKNLTDKVIATNTYGAPVNEVYTLYKDNGTIIAVVTLEAEDNATTTHYAYINSSKIDHREYDAEAKEYSWYREAIVDGEFVMLKEVDDDSTPSYLDGLTQGKWYEVKYNADDEVRGVTAVTYGSGSDASTPSGIALPNGTKPQVGTNYMEDVNATANAIDKTFILNANYTTEKPALKWVGGTLYTGNDTTKGVYVSPTAKVVVFTKEYDKHEEFSGADMTKALSALVDKDHFNGYVNAVVGANGIATAVILDERNMDEADTYSVTFEGDTRNVTDANGAALANITGINKGETKTFTVTAKRGFILESVKIGASDVPVSGGVYTISNITDNVTVTITTKDDPNVITDAVAVIKGDGTDFKVFYKDGATQPSGLSLANLLIQAAEDAGYTDVQATPVSGGYKITGSAGKVGLEVSYTGTPEVSWVGDINGTEVYVKKSTALNALSTWGNSTITTALKGTHVIDETGAATGITGTEVAGTDGYPVATTTITGNDFDLSDGYLKVTGDGIDPATGIMQDMTKPLSIPAKDDLTTPKGTGMTYTVGSGDAKYVVYGGSVAASELTGDVVLDQDYIKVAVELDDALTSAWEIDTSATDTTEFISVAAAQSIKINVTEKTPTAGKATVANTSTYGVAGGLTVASATQAAGTHNVTSGATVLNITLGASAATGDITIKILTIDLDT